MSGLLELMAMPNLNGMERTKKAAESNALDKNQRLPAEGGPFQEHSSDRWLCWWSMIYQNYFLRYISVTELQKGDF